MPSSSPPARDPSKETSFLWRFTVAVATTTTRKVCKKTVVVSGDETTADAMDGGGVRTIVLAGVDMECGVAIHSRWSHGEEKEKDWRRRQAREGVAVEEGFTFGFSIILFFDTRFFNFVIGKTEQNNSK
ncbi:hypothetical protein L6452_06575 [Arctium lappa]|uniref:Uncharacterized protein n=1 Tax=Arctium lappa TaxID=4217 RepID=A0ACB9EJK0_ARCLA|nr:hypothetical protein L6452_06575 [Arctium lappa]